MQLIAMSGEYEAHNVYEEIEMMEMQTETARNEPQLEIVAREYDGFNPQCDDTEVEERQYEFLSKKCKKRWLMIAAFSLLAAVCFGAGVVVGHFGLPSAGRLLSLDGTGSMSLSK